MVPLKFSRVRFGQFVWFSARFSLGERACWTLSSHGVAHVRVLSAPSYCVTTLRRDSEKLVFLWCGSARDFSTIRSCPSLSAVRMVRARLWYGVLCPFLAFLMRRLRSFAAVCCAMTALPLRFSAFGDARCSCVVRSERRTQARPTHHTH